MKVLASYVSGLITIVIYVFFTRKLGGYWPGLEWVVVIVASLAPVCIYLVGLNQNTIYYFIAIAWAVGNFAFYYMYFIWIVLLLTGDSL